MLVSPFPCYKFDSCFLAVSWTIFLQIGRSRALSSTSICDNPFFFRASALVVGIRFPFSPIQLAFSSFFPCEIFRWYHYETVNYHEHFFSRWYLSRILYRFRTSEHLRHTFLWRGSLTNLMSRKVYTMTNRQKNYSIRIRVVSLRLSTTNFRCGTRFQVNVFGVNFCKLVILIV